MNAAFTPARMRITVERYQKMVAAGVLTSEDRVELIEGEILAMAPIGTRHARVTGRLNKRCVLELGDQALVRLANPVDLGAFSEPEPDLMLLKPQAQEYGDTHPRAEDVLLLVEVADSSLAFDQGLKRDLYAGQGIAEYWVIDVNAERVFTYSQPLDGRFLAVRTLRSGDILIPLAFPALQIAVADLFA
jgi:Uma2 family endonuclease